ncbi:unnamed protein product, partial [Vitis vinifera]
MSRKCIQKRKTLFIFAFAFSIKVRGRFLDQSDFIPLHWCTVSKWMSCSSSRFYHLQRKINEISMISWDVWQLWVIGGKKKFLSQGSSLSVGKPEQVLISQSGIFSAGFYPVGDNAYCLAIWFTKPSYDGKHTVVWMANRNQPVNGNFSKLSLLKNGELILTDAGRFIVWTTKAVGVSPVRLHLFNTGNLVLRTSDGVIQWQSFDSPTDTLLPHQPLTRNTRLVSSRTKTNFFSGFYKLYFDNSNVLSLVFDGPNVSSVYWPPSWLLQSSDFGERVRRRLTLDIDGNLRLYSFEEERNKWVVTGEAITEQCKVHGICGPNSVCTYVPGSGSGRRCSCIPGYEVKNRTDRTYGCIQKFNLSCNSQKVGFLLLPHVEFYGYDYDCYPNYTLQMCKKLCLEKCGCIGFQYKYDHICYPKRILLSYDKPVEEFMLDCSENRTEQLMICICVVCCFLMMKAQQNTNTDPPGYILAATGFRKFTYTELKKATRGFSEEIGRGGGGIVYKGVLSDHRVAAIKQLNGANQGEAEFLAEASTIGRLNHMNLIEMWGYCFEGKHRLLVYEYMEHGSLAQNLTSNTLDWQKRFNIAVGTAKGLAYLHEECLEWVLHCDVKPQNILLDSNYQPKVADFGLSKLQNRGGINNSRLSRIRGTRGYMAPEWVLNLPITSKVDVYSYGIVVLEMITGLRIASWIEEILDPSMESKYDMGEMEILVSVALQCVELDKDERPTMSQVVELLLRRGC